MITKTIKKTRNQRKHKRIRRKITGTTERPRLSFFKSNKYLYAQLIDDSKSTTLVSSSTLQKSFKEESKNTWGKDAAKKLGATLAKAAVDKGVKKVVFDRGGFKFHGKVTEFANAAREAGLEF